MFELHSGINPSDFRLEHLVLVPRGGLCNRLQAIASARRICEMVSAKCTLVWNWGDFGEYFQATGIESWPVMAPEAVGYRTIFHRLMAEGGTAKNRVVPLTKEESIVVHSQYVFVAEEEQGVHGRGIGFIRQWLPEPSEAVRQAVRRFQEEHFDGPVVGIHLRRTDNKPARWGTPDELFIDMINRLIEEEDARFFLATDNLHVQDAFQQRYGAKRILFYPKNPDLRTRWPRRDFDPQETFDDVLDLFLLASCHYVVGSRFSSYSRTAVALNGSSRCVLLGDPKRSHELWMRASGKSG